jgi:uncharacterized membrane protein
MDQATVIDPPPSVRRASLGSILVLGAATILALWFLITFALPYLTLDPQRFGPYWPRRSWLLLHITSGMVALLVGPAQLWLGLTRQHLRLHRRLGTGYMASVAISAMAALYLVFHTELGWVFGMGLVGLAIAWIVTTGLAFVAIRRRMIDQHKEWMIRSYVVTFAFVTFRNEEALDLLTLAWTQNQFSYEGAYYHVKDVTVVPKPLQKPHPKLYMVGTSPSSFIAAGTRGVSIAAGGPVPYSVYAPGIDGYKQACAARGYTPDISFIRLVYLDEDARQVRTEAERYVRNFLDFNASAIDSLALYTKELNASGYGFYASGVAEMLRHITYDRCAEEELCFLGTPAQVIAQIRRLDQQIGGLNEMVIISNFGGIEHWKAIKTQHLFAQYVMPALR